ncbi:MAG: AraC family transcriptional regulator [Filifactor alocis]|nr:AraC family transcriptional regulator [Filifactor alocis]
MNEREVAKIMAIKGMESFGREQGYLVFDGGNEGTRIYVGELFEGVSLLVTDYFDIEVYRGKNDVYLQNLNLSYCLEGRMEWLCGNNRYTYLTKNSFMLDTSPLNVKEFRFPTGKLRCLTFSINVLELPVQTRELFFKFGIDIDEIYQRYREKEPYVIRDDDEVNRMFDPFRFELSFDRDLYKLRLLEVLLFIQRSADKTLKQMSYYRKAQTDKIKGVRDCIVRDLSKHYTIEELSQRFSLASTSLKKMFKEIYGTSINKYLVEYKMEEAQRLLMFSDLSVTEIAGHLGYANASKFSKTFCNLKGMTPSKFRILHKEGLNKDRTAKRT